MKKEHTYHLFLLLSTFTRGLVETFSLVLLYKKGFIIEEILFFLLMMYVIGIIIQPNPNIRPAQGKLYSEFLGFLKILVK